MRLPKRGEGRSRASGRGQLVEQWADELGPLYRVKIGARSLTVMSDGALIETVLRARPSTLSRRVSEFEPMCSPRTSACE